MTYTFGAKSGTSKLDQYKNKLSSYVSANTITAKQPRDDTSACWKGPRLLPRTQANTQKTNDENVPELQKL